MKYSWDAQPDATFDTSREVEHSFLNSSPAAELSGVDVKFQTIKTLEPSPPPTWSAPLSPSGCPPNKSVLLISVHPCVATLSTTAIWQGVSPKPSDGPLWWTLGDKPRISQQKLGRVWILQREITTLAERTPYWNVGIGTHLYGRLTLPGPIWRSSGGGGVPDPLSEGGTTHPWLTPSNTRVTSPSEWCNPIGGVVGGSGLLHAPP